MDIYRRVRITQLREGSGVMKAYLYNGFGDTSVIQECEVPRPPLKAGQIRIAVRASGLNRADLVQRRGHYPPPPGESDIPGLEVSGEVLESRGKAFRRGDRVMALLASGGYGEEVCVDAGLALKLPSKFSFAEGAATMEAFLTAHHNLFTLGEFSEGQSVLIHSGASGVGTAAIQLLRKRASTLFATVGSEEKALAVSRLGAEPILYKQQSFKDRVLSLKATGVNIILDTVGGPNLDDNLRCLAIGGRLICIGLLGGRSAKLEMDLLLARRAHIVGSTLRPLPLPEKRRAVKAFSKQFLPLLMRRKIFPVLDRILPMKEIGAAQQRMESNQNIGKIVLLR